LKVTLNPCASVENVSATSRMIEGIELKSNKPMQDRQFGRSGCIVPLRDSHLGYFPA
jgi:hypothetical protein